jgi:hypothetical protein
MFHIQIVRQIKTYFMFSYFPPPQPPENPAVYEIMWKNMAEPDRPQMTTWRMRVACWITQATDTHSEYVALITFLPQQWLRERASMLRKRALSVLLTLCVNNSKRADERNSTKQATLTESPLVGQRSCSNADCCLPQCDGVTSSLSRLQENVVCE